MKKFWKEIWLPELSGKQRLTVWYFTASMVLLGSVADNAPLWLIITLLVNFINAARLLAKIPFKDGTEEV
jgi:hypothetical protein